MPAPSPSLTIHYRRAPPYALWHLWLWHPSSPSASPRCLLPLVAAPRAPPESAWGAVYHLPLADLPPGPLAILPCTPGWADKDAVGEPGGDGGRVVPHEWLVDGASLFMLQGEQQVFRTVFEPRWRGLQRFVAVRIGRVTAAGGAEGVGWLVVEGGGVKKEAFAAPRRRGRNGQERDGEGVVLVDRKDFGAGQELKMWVVRGAEEAQNVLVGGGSARGRVRAPMVWLAGQSAVVDVVDTRDGERLAAGEVEEVEEVLIAQGEQVPGVGRFAESLGEAEPCASDAAQVVAAASGRRSVGARILYVQYRSLAVSRHEAPGLVANGVGGEGVSVPVQSLESDVCDAVGAVALWKIDLRLYEDEEIGGGLLLELVGAHGRAVSRGGFEWDQQRCGWVVVITDGPRGLLPAGEVDVALVYSRFDALEDWADWELRVWVKEGDVVSGDGAKLPHCNTNGDVDMSQSQHLKASEKEVMTLSKARLVEDDTDGCGRLAFDLTMVAALAPDAMLRVQAVKTAPADNHDGSHGLGGLESSRAVVKRDIERRFSVGELLVDGGTAFREEVYIVQADSRLLYEEPSRDAIDADRFVEVEYRRHEDDYSDWDLWCWDDSDVSPTEHSVAQDNTTRPACVGSPGGRGQSFVVDRAAFGNGGSIQVLPRRGGHRWLEKDEPARALPGCRLDSHANGMRSVFAAQGLPLVLNDMNEARSMLCAAVEDEDTISISSPVPFEWVLPGDAEMKPEVVLFDVHADEVPRAEWGTYSARRVLRSSSLERAGHLVLLYHLRPQTSELVSRDDDNVTLDEDFLVENTVVCFPGFDICHLTWTESDDWDEYFYPGNLGWEYSEEKCLFRCFAPAAEGVSVVLYDSAEGGVGKHVPMRRIHNGSWKATIPGDLKGKYYKLLAVGSDKRLFPDVEVIDPYSRCNTSHTGRGLIFGYESTVVAPRPDIKPEQTIVYELHLRDATVDPASGVDQKGKYIGMTERGTQITKAKCGSLENEAILPDALSTGLDHILEMGVTAVQIMPVQDFDNDESDPNAYRWGYMPVHFFSPDGWYASRTDTVARVTEFKLLVDAFHKAGLKVIMDVVYNHTAEDGNEFNLDARFSFNGLAPRYFYRNCGNTPVAHTGDSTCAHNASRSGPNCGTCVSNGSGCGNEFRSESPMGRKFILDSLKYWVNEYKVDGFRFDLLGLIDVETMAIVSSELKKIDQNIVVYGEPWCGGLTPIRSTEKGMQRSRGFGVFNNSFRDALRGSPFGIEETFVMDGCRIDEVKRGIIGSIDEFADSPLESINYVECHDNYTLWDHFKFYVGQRTDNITFSESDLIRMHKLAALVVLTSQGIPMIQIGQEMCRTKFGDENSYESPDSVNMVRWESKFSRLNVVKYYQGLVGLRRTHPELFCISDQSRVRHLVTFFEDLGQEVPSQCIAYQIEADVGFSERDRSSIRDEWNAVIVLLNAQPCQVSFELPGGDSLQHWIVVVDSERAGVSPLALPVRGSFTVAGRSGAVLRKASPEENVVALMQDRLDCVSDAFAYPVDEIPSPYAVGLARERSPEEQEAVQELVRRREAFLSQGSPLRDKAGIANPIERG